MEPAGTVTKLSNAPSACSAALLECSSPPQSLVFLVSLAFCSVHYCVLWHLQIIMVWGVFEVQKTQYPLQLSWITSQWFSGGYVIYSTACEVTWGYLFVCSKILLWYYRDRKRDGERVRKLPFVESKHYYLLQWQEALIPSQARSLWQVLSLLPGEGWSCPLSSGVLWPHHSRCIFLVPRASCLLVIEESVSSRNL